MPSATAARLHALSRGAAGRAHGAMASTTPSHWPGETGARPSSVADEQRQRHRPHAGECGDDAHAAQRQAGVQRHQARCRRRRRRQRATASAPVLGSAGRRTASSTSSAHQANRLGQAGNGQPADPARGAAAAEVAGAEGHGRAPSPKSTPSSTPSLPAAFAALYQPRFGGFRGHAPASLADCRAPVVELDAGIGLTPPRRTGTVRQSSDASRAGRAPPARRGAEQPARSTWPSNR